MCIEWWFKIYRSKMIFTSFNTDSLHLFRLKLRTCRSIIEVVTRIKSSVKAAEVSYLDIT